MAYALTPTATADTAIGPDGWDSLTFANFTHEQNGTAISGSVQWTCTG